MCTHKLYIGQISLRVWIHNVYIISGWIHTSTWSTCLSTQTLFPLITHGNLFKWCVYKSTDECSYLTYFVALLYIFCLYLLSWQWEDTRHTQNQWCACHVVLTGPAGGDGWCIYEAPFRALDQGLQASSSQTERGTGGSRDDGGKDRGKDGWLEGRRRKQNRGI